MKRIFQKMLCIALGVSILTTSFATTHVESVIVPATEKPVTINEAIKNATAEFKNLSKKERKERLRNVKSEVKAFNKAKKSGAEPSTNTLLLVILALLLPPLAVYLHEGAINNKFWISLILTLLFFIPGVIYALIVVLGEG